MPLDHHHDGCRCTRCRVAVLAIQERFDRVTVDDLPGELDHLHHWDEVGDGCWDCLLGLYRAGVPVYLMPDCATDVAATFPREELGGLVLEVRVVDTRKVGYLRPVLDHERRRRVVDFTPPHIAAMALNELARLVGHYDPLRLERIGEEVRGG